MMFLLDIQKPQGMTWCVFPVIHPVPAFLQQGLLRTAIVAVILTLDHNQLQVSIILPFPKMNSHIFDNFYSFCLFENIKFCETKVCDSLIPCGFSFFANKFALMGNSQPAQLRIFSGDSLIGYQKGVFNLFSILVILVMKISIELH